MKQRKLIEDYLKVIYMLYQKKGYVRGLDVAAELNVSRPTVSVSLRELEEAGYLTMNKSREVFLTEMGESIAQEILERHATFCELLELLNVDQQTAESDACQMEHVVSQQSYLAFKKLTEYLVLQKENQYV